MKKIATLLTVAVLASGCSQMPNVQLPNLTTGSITPQAPAAAGPTRGRPVVAGRPARMYIFAGFKEKDCSPVQANLSLAQQPAKGTVEFRPGQTTTIMQSGSGKCIGTKLPGIGVYYTAAEGQTGTDRFVVSATTPTGEVSSKTFDLKIAQ
jgi:hypothetical protein